MKHFRKTTPILDRANNREDDYLAELAYRAYAASSLDIRDSSISKWIN